MEFSTHVELLPTSTIYISLKHLVKEGSLLKDRSPYYIDDVFFERRLIRRVMFYRKYRVIRYFLKNGSLNSILPPCFSMIPKRISACKAA